MKIHLISCLKTHIHFKSGRMHATRHIQAHKTVNISGHFILSFGWWLKILLSWCFLQLKHTVYSSSSMSEATVTMATQWTHFRTLPESMPFTPTSPYIQNSSAAGFLSNHIKCYGSHKHPFSTRHFSQHSAYIQSHWNIKETTLTGFIQKDIKTLITIKRL